MSMRPGLVVRLALGVGSAGAVLGGGAASALVAACGPGFQAVYEGDVRFEHCYALEETASASMRQRSDCWRDWTLRYTYGQTRDRVEYAAARYRALSRAPTNPTDEAMMQAAPNEGRPSSVMAPAPTSAFAPPPKTLNDYDSGADGAPVPAAVPFAPMPTTAAPGTPTVGRLPPETKAK